MSKSQVEVDQVVRDFLGDQKIETPDDLVVLRSKIREDLEFRPYNDETKEEADSIQWKRTASEIIKDGYVYQGKACSDLTIVFLAMCKANGVEGRLVKLVGTDIHGKDAGHSIAEVNLGGCWYTIDISTEKFMPKEGELTDESTYYSIYKVWKKGRDVWDMGLDGIESEKLILK